MKVISFNIKSDRESAKEFAAAWKAAEGRKPFRKSGGSHFTSMDAARNFLTPKRRELLHLIKWNHPRSLSDLARMAGRSFPSVFRDVEMLTRHGLVRQSRPAHSPRRAVHPHVDYDRVNVGFFV